MPNLKEFMNPLRIIMYRQLKIGTPTEMSPVHLDIYLVGTKIIDTIVTGIGNAIKTFGTLLVMPRPSKLGINKAENLTFATSSQN